MNPEERSLLERTYKMAEENNEILKSIRRSNRLSMIMRVLYWVVIIGLSFGAYYFIQPYIEMLMGVSGDISGKVSGNVDNVQNMASQIQDLLR